jgi:beta-lactamase regulating signal transducer with metallopeptidase domain
MIAEWMLFSIEIGALLYSAAWLMEHALLAVRRPVRFVWFGASVLATLLPVLAWFAPARNSFSASWTDRLTSFTLLAHPVLQQFGLPLLLLWIGAAAIGFTVCAIAIFRMSRERAHWQSEYVDGTPVLVSHDVGPALVGVLHYSIVIPRWAFALEESARGLLLSHEREHARKYDPLLLALAVLFVVVAPWNVFNWLMFKRLHLAVELDCDQRVLKSHPDTNGYGALLLDVAERVLPSVMPAAAFVEYGSSLERRITAMIGRSVPFRALRATASGLAAVLLFAIACVAPAPYASTSGAERAGIVPSGSSAPAPIIDAKVAPVAPSAYVLGLDRADDERTRHVVIAVAPRTLGDWPRADSALVLLYNDDGAVVKQSVIATARLSRGVDARSVLFSIFMPPAISALTHAEMRTVTTDVRGARLSAALRLVTGHLAQGARVPQLHSEVLPSQEKMVATLRATHPEVLSDTSRNPLVGALLYGARGELLMSSVVRMPSPPTIVKGQEPQGSLYLLMRRAFGGVLDSGVIIESGHRSYFDSATPPDGLPRLLYALMVPYKVHEDEVIAQNQRQQSIVSSVTRFSGASSRFGAVLPTPEVMNKHLFSLAQSRVPEAFGRWSRADSAVVLVFDADEQLVGRTASAIPSDLQLKTLVDLIGARVPGLSPDDIDAVGGTPFLTTEGGRELDTPLVVLWGRLRAGVSFPAKP